MKLSTNLSIILVILPLCQSAPTTFEKDVSLTKTEKDALEEFKLLMENKVPHEYMKSDLYLLKWLRSKKYNILRAQEGLTNHLRWRDANQMDTINQEDWSDMEREFKYSLDSRDKQGQPTIYYDVGGTDMRKMVIQGKGDRIVRYAMKVFEEACTLIRTMGEEQKNVTRGILILNAKGFNPIQHGCVRCIPFLLRIVVGHLSEFPECADKIIVTNVPSLAEPLVALAKPLLENNDLTIYGPHPKQYLEALLKVYDIDQIPVQLGGRKVYKEFVGDFDFK